MARTIVTVDKAGRLVLPKSIRDRFRLGPGSQLEVDAQGEHLKLRPIEQGPSLVKVNGWWVYQGVPEPGVDLTDAVERHRAERLEDLAR